MGTHEDGREGSHGLLVKEAMTSGERAMTALVLLANLALGAWLVGHADFSTLRPHAVDASSAAADVLP